MNYFSMSVMSSMEEQLGKGYQQMIIGLIVFIAGAIWGGMQATEGMVAEDVYWPAVMMLSGAMYPLPSQVQESGSCIGYPRGKFSHTVVIQLSLSHVVTSAFYLGFFS